MADTKISALSAVTSVVGTDEFVLARSSTTKKITALNLGLAADGWIDDSANTWTYVSASTFTVTGDRTGVFAKGTRLRFTQTTVKYAVVVGSSHSAGTTTVTIGVNNDYTIANAAITVNSFSYYPAPLGYPTIFSFTPTYTGFSANPAASAAQYTIIGGLCFFAHGLVTGTSNATTFTMTAPVTPTVNAAGFGRAYNSGAFAATPGLVDITAASAVINLYRDGTGLAWTNTGLKTISFEIILSF